MLTPEADGLCVFFCVCVVPSPPPHFKVGNQLNVSSPPRPPSLWSIESADPRADAVSAYDSIGMFCITLGGGDSGCGSGGGEECVD